MDQFAALGIFLFVLFLLLGTGVWIGLALMVTAIGALQFVLDQGESKDWFSSRLILVAALVSAFAGPLIISMSNAIICVFLHYIIFVY